VGLGERGGEISGNAQAVEATPTPTPADAPSGRFGKYEIRGTLGKGAAATVYLAHDTFANRPVALKVIDPTIFGHPKFREVYKPQFQVEASLAGKLNHPHIVSIYDAVIGDDAGHVVMEYVAGGNLLPYVSGKNLMPVDSAIELVFKCCGALDYAFRHGIVHRDIKPANIMVGEGTDVKIGDFGAALLQASEQSQRIRAGTPSYMSPEQIQSQPLTEHSDMFCLGIVLYELLTGVKPFAAKNVPQIFARIVSQDPVPPSEVRAGVPKALDAIVLRALAKVPEERFATWADFALELANIGRMRSSQQAVPDSERYESMKRVKLLGELSDPDLWALVKAGQWTRAGANQVIIGEDEQSDRLYFLAKGEVKVTKRTRLLNVIRAGEFFGEMSFISGGASRRQATVESLSELIIASFDRAALERVRANSQLSLLWTILGNMADRLALADARLAQTP
jgi:serine/threonine protein kinase